MNYEIMNLISKTNKVKANINLKMYKNNVLNVFPLFN